MGCIHLLASKIFETKLEEVGNDHESYYTLSTFCVLGIMLGVLPL